MGICNPRRDHTVFLPTCHITPILSLYAEAKSAISSLANCFAFFEFQLEFPFTRGRQSSNDAQYPPEKDVHEQATCVHTPTERVVAPRRRQGPRYRPLQFDRYLVLPISSSLRPNPNTYISSPRILGSTCTQSTPLVTVRPSSLPSLRP